MKKILRSELHNQLESLGILKDSKHEVTGEYCLNAAYDGSLVVELKKRPFYNTIAALTNCLTLQAGEWLLYPRFTYLGSEENTKNTSLPISPGESDGVIWSIEDLETINIIISLHATSGWQIGWDLYLSDQTGNYLILISHHDEVIIQSKSKEYLQKLGECLALKKVHYENNL